MKLSPEFLIAIGQSLGWMLVHSLWQGALIGGALWCSLRLLGQSSAALRHAVCLAAMLALVAGAIATAVHQPWPARHPSPPKSAENGPEIHASEALASPPPTPRHSLAAGQPRFLESPNRAWRLGPGSFSFISAHWVEPLLPWTTAGWVGGMLLISIRRLLALRTLRGWRKRSASAGLGLEHIFARLLSGLGCSGRVSLLVSAEAAVPMLAGIVRPVVLLPMQVATGLGEPEIEAILAHELAHYLRHDAWSNLAQVAVETVFFYHPVMWWIGRRARQEREEAADDLTLGLCPDRRLYAGALGRLAELCFEPSPALAATGGSLLARIQKILKPAELAAYSSGWSAGLPVMLGFFILALAASGQPESWPKAAPVSASAEWQLEEKIQIQAQPWVEDALQENDPAKRARAIAHIRQAMENKRPEEARLGATALAQLGALEFDKASFRPAVRALLISPDALTRQAAAAASAVAGTDPQDEQRILAMVDDPSPVVRAELGLAIACLYHGDLTGRGGEAALKLLATEDRRQLDKTLQGIGSYSQRDGSGVMARADYSPALEARVLALSQNLTNGEVGKNISHDPYGAAPEPNAEKVAYDALYYALASQTNKSEAAVRRLIELMGFWDPNIWTSAAVGLWRGVGAAQSSLVADAMMKILSARSDDDYRDRALRILERYGGVAQVPALQALLERPGITGPFRATLEKMLTRWLPAPHVAAASPQGSPAQRLAASGN